MKATLPSIALAALLAAAAVADSDAGLVDRQVAVVNGRSISFSDVVRDVPAFLAEIRAEPDAPKDPEQAFRLAFRRALDEAENRALVLLKYEEGEMRLPDHAADRYTAEILQSRYGGNRQRLLEELAERGMTYAEWRERAEEGMVVAAMRQHFVDGGAHVSPNEVAQAYEARKASFVRPARMHLRVVSVPAADTNAVASFAARPGRNENSPGAKRPSYLRSSSQVSSFKTVFSGSG